MATNPVKAIREKCLDCCCGQIKEVRECISTKCPLHPFRMGNNPYRTKREMSAEQRAAATERLRIAREKKNVEVIE